ncbi:MAG: hypothetical protein IKZ44_01395 [Clostridia bacterium]|nr:hypothetical protein [Clostridia bacterium]
MKRIILCLSLALLLACVPTPEEEFVVNKSDRAPSAAAENTVSESRTDLSAIPKHLTFEAQPQNGVSVKVDADVEIDRSGTFPILEVRQSNTPKDAAFYKALLGALCPDGTVYERWTRTKEEIQEELVAALSYDGQAGSLIEIDSDYIGNLEEQYRNAPESAERIAHSISDGFEPGKRYYIVQPDGTVALLGFGPRCSEGYFYDDYHTAYYTEDALEKGDAPLSSEPPITEQEAVRTADALIKALGVECDAVIETERGFAFSVTKLVREDTVWWVHYLRRVGSTCSLDLRDLTGWSYPSEPSTVLGAPWEGVESIHVVVGKEGVCCILWDGLAETTGVLSKNATLCDFDTVKDRFVAQLGYRYAPHSDAESMTVRVHRVALVYGVLSKKDQRDVGVYMPLWEISYTLEDNGPDVWKMYFSALDGGTAEPRITTDNLAHAAMEEP